MSRMGNLIRGCVSPGASTSHLGKAFRIVVSMRDLEGKPGELSGYAYSRRPVVLGAGERFGAAKSSCEAYVDDTLGPSRRVSEFIQLLRENRWPSEGKSVHLNKKKCEYLRRWLISAGASCPLNTRASAKREFCAAVERARSLMEECSHDEWLLKAVELWECTEHFVEVLLDLCWSAYIMNLGVGSIEQAEEWMSEIENLLDPSSEAVGLFHSEYNKTDKEELNLMVDMERMDKALKVDGPEHQLAHLLQNLLKSQNLWRPPFLRRNSYFIYREFAPQRSTRRGSHGVIVKFPWVYGKEFAMKTSHSEDMFQETFQWEFNILDKYRSPYIVVVVGYWEAKSRSSWNPFTSTVLSPFLLMESLEFDLADLIQMCKSVRVGTREGFSELETVNLMLPIAKALRFLHGKDVAHRDVKPRDIMCKNVNLPKYPEESIVKGDTIVKLVDFGEARENVLDIPDDGWGRAGTYGYMDPTMWKENVVGYTLFMGDVFGFAMVFTELLTWRSPREAFGVKRMLAAQAKLKADERPLLPSHLPGYLRFIVESCWHVDHLKRPDFQAICSMLQHAKILLSDKDFAYKFEDLFSYEDATGEYCCISDEA